MQGRFRQGLRPGARASAIAYRCARDGTNNEYLPETRAVIKQFWALIEARYMGRMFLAAADGFILGGLPEGGV